MIDKLSAEEREKFLFSFLIMSYQTSALMQMGQLKDPHTQTIQRNIDNAKLSIDILGMLQQKTKNNLTKDEADLLESILRELRLAYIKETSGDQPSRKTSDS